MVVLCEQTQNIMPYINKYLRPYLYDFYSNVHYAAAAKKNFCNNIYTYLTEVSRPRLKEILVEVEVVYLVVPAEGDELAGEVVDAAVEEEAQALAHRPLGVFGVRERELVLGGQVLGVLLGDPGELGVV